MNWKVIKKCLPIIGIGLFIYLLVKYGARVSEEIKNVILGYVGIAFIFLIIVHFLQTWKWFAIAKKQKINISFWEAFRVNLISNFYGFVTPGKLGTVIRANYLKKKGAETGKGISNFVLDKVLDICSLFILTIGFGFVLYKEIISIRSLFILLGMFLLMILLFFIFYKKEYSRFLLRFVYKKLIPDKWKDKSRRLFNSFYEDLPPLSHFLFYFILNLSTWVVSYVIVYLIGLSLGINVNFAYFLIILPISTLVAQIPITIDGFGTRELTLIGLFGLLGVSEAKVLSMSILNIFLAGIIPSIIAIILILSEKKDDIHKV
jgi:glycosyltransferase 2 family protein